MKVALVCTGIGVVNRGFEIFFQTLYQKLKGTLDVPLYTGKGPSVPGARTVWNISRNSRAWGIIGKTQHNFFRRYKIEQLSSVLPFLLEIVFRRFDVIHTSEYHLGASLLVLLKNWKRRPRVVFHNGHPLPPSVLHPFDHIQQLTLPRYEEGLRSGLPEDKMSLLPIGVDSARFTQPQRAEARQLLGIPSDAFLVLSVGAINSWHKRMDWTIDEIQRVPQKPMLAVAGHHEEETDTIVRAGKEKMGTRIRFFDLPYEEIHILYRAADIFVLSSLYEGFGMVFTEAMAAGLPVVAHHDPTIVWLIGDGGVPIDMTQRGMLASTVSSLIDDRDRRMEIGKKAQEAVSRHFTWDVLIPKYIMMYRNLTRESASTDVLPTSAAHTE